MDPWKLFARTKELPGQQRFDFDCGAANGEMAVEGAAPFRLVWSLDETVSCSMDSVDRHWG